MLADPALKELANARETTRDVPGGMRLFHRFTPHKLLGHGVTGAVWLARDDQLERFVALKLLPETVCVDSCAREALRRETQKGLLLTHPNIVPVFDFIEDKTGAAIAMEYVDGATLASARLQKRARCFAVSEIAPWVASLCDALAYAHGSMGMIHRDLKPSNLMLNSRMELEITDFGIAGALRDCLRRSGARPSIDTLSYLSPQQLRGDDPSPADDIYAVGATLYEMLSSRPPFFEGKIEAQIRDATAPAVAERRRTLGIVGEAVPRYWEETIAACLAKNPAERPANAVDLARCLRLGGTIRLAAAQQESKVRALLHALAQARLVGAAAGVAALVAAAVLVVRSSHPSSALLASANRTFPGGFAMELFRTEPASGGTTIVPDGDPESNSETVAGTNPLARKTGSLQFTTTPAGASYAIYPGVIAGTSAPSASALHSGVAPESIGDLPPGRYTIFFRNEGWPEERTEVSLEEGENLPVDCTFPHGNATITSVPDGAEIFLGTRSLGYTPLTADLPLGEQTLTARHPDRPERSETVTIESESPATVAFTLAQNQAGGRSKPKPPETAIEKLGRSLKKVFTRKPPARKTKS